MISKSVRSELSKIPETKVVQDNSLTIIICTVVGVSSLIIGFGLLFGF
jgi:hypothetical protein